MCIAGIFPEKFNSVLKSLITLTEITTKRYEYERCWEHSVGSMSWSFTIGSEQETIRVEVDRAGEQSESNPTRERGSESLTAPEQELLRKKIRKRKRTDSATMQRWSSCEDQLEQPDESGSAGQQNFIASFSPYDHSCKILLGKCSLPMTSRLIKISLICKPAALVAVRILGSYAYLHAQEITRYLKKN